MSNPPHPTHTDRDDFDALQQIIEGLLRQTPNTTEYELIRQLKAAPYHVFDAHALADPLDLFRCHFIVSHCLYRIQRLWFQTHVAYLDIQATRIDVLPIDNLAADLPTTHAPTADVHPTDKRAHTLSCHDQKLADYYLDLSNLTNTDADDVNELLTGFFKRMVSHDVQQHQDDLDVLGLTPPVTWRDAQSRWRSLAMQHHPDRGGDHDTFQRISAAYQRLKPHLA